MQIERVQGDKRKDRGVKIELNDIRRWTSSDHFFGP